RSGSRLTQCVGISDSGSRYLTVSWLTGLPLRMRARRILWLEQGADEPSDFPRTFCQATPCDPDDAVAGCLQHGIALTVAFERAAPTVELPTVELDDEPMLRPERVDEVTLHEHVAGRQREPERSAEIEE